ncbi:hypothetical protein [Mesorhizobium sp. M1348]|uniref:hypothetical protein n=1 Tax=unclassified Mesorhizobium TaxID=325217 RepID=UPI003336D1AB
MTAVTPRIPDEPVSAPAIQIGTEGMTCASYVAGWHDVTEANVNLATERAT